jgi:hypothetical protein
MATEIRYGKLQTRYAKKWHIVHSIGPYGFYSRAKCGYTLFNSDETKTDKPKKEELCQTCLMVMAHEKQKLNRYG